MSTFAATFRNIVMPRLRRQARVQGLFVALDLRTFSEACSSVWADASRRGAAHLPDSLIDELNDWIATQVLNAAIEFEPTEEDKARAERVWADVSQWNSAVLDWAEREASLCQTTA